eukprot:TRINITY_DN8926_c0_g1_i1.p1 TRINITY_DN8926_c0_g1~~TRINITY_DN8926_c0_g1_i1.p1  ORF type:complete len:552 (+),score=110.49 TRINITY_DN8926_c0_g1_i1:180-1658(+)
MYLAQRKFHVMYSFIISVLPKLASHAREPHLENQAFELLYFCCLACFETKNYAQGFLHINEYCSQRTIPNSPLGGQLLFLMGKLSLNTGLKANAVQYFKKSLEVNPLLWSSQKELNELNKSTEVIDPFSKASLFKGTKTWPSENLRVGAAFERTEDLSNENAVNHEDDFRSILRLKMKAHQLFFRYESLECLKLLEALPSRYMSLSHWGLVLKGRCYFEKSDYKKACAIFENLRKRFPFVLVGLEWYSTCLWHLKKDVELANLSQEVSELDRFASQTWIILGNCFSVQREHESALKFLNRAIQADPFFSYSYTLAGHEHFANEDYEKAISMYRQALSVDDRHYTAWYGLGNVFFRQQKNALAIYHFRKALTINPHSSILRCYLGMALQANGDTVEAFNEYENASSLNPTNLVVQFQKAKLYIATNVLDSAVQLLEEILQSAPKEAVVHFELGCLYKQIDHAHRAVHHLQIALDLNPKDSNMIKPVIDSILKC